MILLTFVLVSGAFFFPIIFLQIKEAPLHGAIERSEGKGQFGLVAEFPAEAVAAGEVFYKHDDSESARDRIAYDVIKENTTEILQSGEVGLYTGCSSTSL